MILLKNIWRTIQEHIIIVRDIMPELLSNNLNKKGCTMNLNLKKSLHMVCIIVVALILCGLYVAYHFGSTENMIINKHRIVVVENTQKVNSDTIEDHSIKQVIVDQDKFEQLKQYMKDNNLSIKPGRYEVHDADSFEKLIKRLEFEKNT